MGKKFINTSGIYMEMRNFTIVTIINPEPIENIVGINSVKARLYSYPIE